MKNKLVINIIIAYFIVLCVVLVIQLNNDSNDTVSQVQTIEVDVPKPNKMKDSIAIKIGSSSVLLNDRLFSINSNDETIVPKIIGQTAYVPAKLFSSAFNANVSWDNDLRQIVIRYNNKAVVLKENENKIKIIDNINEEENVISNSLKLINGNAYLPLKDVVDVFEKNVFFDRDVIIISNKDIEFDKVEEKVLIDDIIQKFKTRNVIVFKTNDNVVLLNEQNSVIDEQNDKIVPVVENNKIYLPVKMISSNFGGEVEWNPELKEISLNYNNFAVRFNQKNDKVVIVEKGEESEVIMPAGFKNLNGYSYISLDAFAEAFQRNVFVDGEFVFISGKDNVFVKEKDNDIIQKLENNIQKVIK